VVATCARPVLDNKLLAEALGKPWTNQARDGVSRSTGRKTRNNADRPPWIGLRPRDRRDGRKSGSARGHLQEFPTCKFHRPPLLAHRAHPPSSAFGALLSLTKDERRE
jgi:hypothetical protein